MNKSRYEFIDIAKGIGIILVMMGHFFIYRLTVVFVNRKIGQALIEN